MPEKSKNLSEAYERFDLLKEQLEFTDNEKALETLDDALEALNRYLMEVEADKK